MGIINNIKTQSINRHPIFQIALNDNISEKLKTEKRTIFMRHVATNCNCMHLCLEQEQIEKVRC